MWISTTTIITLTLVVLVGCNIVYGGLVVTNPLSFESDINTAVDDTTVMCVAGTYIITSTVISHANLTIVGAGADQTIFSCNSTNYNGFLFTNSIILKNLAVQNCKTGVEIISTNPPGAFATIQSCVFKNNNDSGVQIKTHTQTIIDNSIFTNNSSPLGGGGLYSQTALLSVISSEFHSNFANGYTIGTPGTPDVGAGGIYIVSTDRTQTANIQNTIIKNNTGFVGGVWSRVVSGAGANINIRNCDISNNIGYLAGGVRGEGSSNITFSNITNNYASATTNLVGTWVGGSGGVSSNGPMWMDGCLISSNRIPSGALGAGIRHSAGLAHIYNTKIIANTALGQAGGIFFDNVGGVLSHCIVEGNTGGSYPGGVYANLFGSELLIEYSEIKDSYTSRYCSGILYSGFSGAKLTIVNSNITGNRAAELGGGLCGSFGALNITGSIFRSNVAINGRGGGLEVQGSQVTIRDSKFIENFAYNSAGNGAGISHFGGTLDIKNVEFLNNTAQQNGGGLHLQAPTKISDCYFFGNNARAGGGMSVNVGTAAWTNFTSLSFKANSADFGGGISSLISSNIINSVFTQNIGRNLGAGLFVAGGTYTFNNCTITNNYIKKN